MSLKVQPYPDEFLTSIYQQRDWCIGALRKKTGCSKEDAEDIFIEALLVMEQKHSAGKLNSVNDLNTYLLGICYTCSKRSYFNSLKQQNAEKDIERYFYHYLEEISLPFGTQLSGKEELLMAVEFSLRSLGEKCQQLIRMFYYEKKNMTRIASILGFSDHRAAAVSKFRCFKTLKKKAISLKTQFEKEK